MASPASKFLEIAQSRLFIALGFFLLIGANGSQALVEGSTFNFSTSATPGNPAFPLACDSTIVISGDSTTIDVVAINYLTDGDSNATIVRLGITEKAKSKIAACVEIQRPGFYRILPRVAHSKAARDQSNESFFLTAFRGDGTRMDQCEPNLGPNKIVVPDVNTPADTLTRNGGVFRLEAGRATFYINHYELIADEFPDLKNGEFSGPESVHLVALTLIRIDVNYDLAVSKRSNRRSVAPGATVQYELNIQNIGSATAHRIQLADAIPESIEASAFSPAPTSRGPDSLFWQFDSLRASETITITYDAKVADSFPALPHSLVNVARIAALCDTDATNNEARAEVLVSDGPDLILKKTVSSDTAYIGERFRYQIKLLNFGPEPASNILLSDSLPDSIVALGFSIDPISQQDRNLQWPFASLDSADSVEIEITAVFPDSLDLPRSPLERTNTVIVTASNDSNPANDSARVSIIIRQPRSDLTLVKTANAAGVAQGEEFSYTLTVTNLGPDPAKRVALMDAVLEPLQVMAATPIPTSPIDADTLVWAFDSLAPDSSVTIQIFATVPPSAALSNCPAEIVNSGWVAYDNEVNPTNNRASVSVSVACTCPLRYDLALKKRVRPTAILGVEEFEYTLTIENLGPGIANAFTLTDSPSDLVAIAGVSSNPITSLDADTLRWRFEALDPGDSLTVKLTARLSGTAPTDRTLTIENSAFISAECDTNDANDFAHATAVYSPLNGCEIFRLDRNVFMPQAQAPLQITAPVNLDDRVSLDVFDITGHHIRDLSANIASNGNLVQWDGLTEQGQQVGSGVYLVVFRSFLENRLSFECVQKVIVAR